MKNLYIILVTLFFIGCSEKRVLFSDLESLNGYYYFEEKLYTGIVYEVYENGQLEWEGKIKNGKYHGVSKDYLENGQLEWEANYRDGKKEGQEKIYYESGQLKWEGNMKDNQPEGLCKWYHENGLLQIEGNYKDGKKDGLWTYYSKTGQLKTRQWKGGLPYYHFDETTRCDYKGKMVISLKKEPCVPFTGFYYLNFPNGNLDFESYVENGWKEGKTIGYYRSGEKYIEQYWEYKNGYNRVYKCVSWKKDGTKIVEYTESLEEQLKREKGKSWEERMTIKSKNSCGWGDRDCWDENYTLVDCE